jgi:hypothetical protein
MAIVDSRSSSSSISSRSRNITFNYSSSNVVVTSNSSCGIINAKENRIKAKQKSLFGSARNLFQLTNRNKSWDVKKSSVSCFLCFYNYLSVNIITSI